MPAHPRQAVGLPKLMGRNDSPSSTPTISVTTVTTTVFLRPTGYCPECLGSVIGGPDANCTGYYIESHCVRKQVWMAMYNYWWSTSSNPPEPSIEAVPGVRIQGPHTQCEGYRINTRCFDKDELRDMAEKLNNLTAVANAMSTTSYSLATLTSFVASTANSTPANAPTADPPSPAHKTNPKLGLIAIPLVFITLALVGGFWFWRRRKLKKAASAPHIREVIPSPVSTLGELYPGRGTDIELNQAEPAELNDEKAPIPWDPRMTYTGSFTPLNRRRYSRKGVRFFNEQHERKELHKEKEREERRSAEESARMREIAEAESEKPVGQ